MPAVHPSVHNYVVALLFLEVRALDLCESRGGRSELSVISVAVNRATASTVDVRKAAFLVVATGEAYKAIFYCRLQRENLWMLSRE